MTKNEKAASFIGWKPGLSCLRHYLANGTITCPHMRQPFDPIANNPFGISFNHPIVAPDMTDPRNYMQALGNLKLEGTRRDGMLAALARAISNSDPNEVVEFLAAVYDAR